MDNFRKERLAFFLPNIFTALNMGCGFVGIMLAIQSNYYLACIVVFLGAVFDSVDGRVARMTGTQSAFGEQFDSMSDLVSFGMAPALIFYNKFLIEYGRVGMVFAFFFLLCGALRLARFNANIDKTGSDYFQGLPIPGGAVAVLSLVLLSQEFTDIHNFTFFPIIYICFYSLLMISSIPFPSFKNSEWTKRHKKTTFFMIITVATFTCIYEQIMVPLIITLYVVISLVQVALNREKFKAIFDWDQESDF